jgi:predicted amidohydrolase
MRAGFLQFFPEFGAVEANLNYTEKLLANLEADLMVLPELAFTGYLWTHQEEVKALAEPVPQGPSTQRLIAWSRAKQNYIVAGLAEQEGGSYYNSAVLVGPQGYIATYRKLHLFNEEKLWFSPGNLAPQVYDIGIAKIGIMICFDWIFPEMMRTLALKGAQIICHCANLVLPFCPEAMRTRCLENRVFAITANRIGTEKRGGKSLTYIGKSQVVDTLGNILCRASDDQEETRIVMFNPKEAENKGILEYNDLFADRRSEFYCLE